MLEKLHLPLDTWGLMVTIGLLYQLVSKNATMTWRMMTICSADWKEMNSFTHGNSGVDPEIVHGWMNFGRFFTYKPENCTHRKRQTCKSFWQLVQNLRFSKNIIKRAFLLALAKCWSLVNVNWRHQKGRWRAGGPSPKFVRHFKAQYPHKNILKSAQWTMGATMKFSREGHNF